MHHLLVQFKTLAHQIDSFLPQSALNVDATNPQQSEKKRETPLMESPDLGAETEYDHAQSIDVTALPDTIQLDYEHKNATFGNFNCNRSQKLEKIRIAIQRF